MVYVKEIGWEGFVKRINETAQKKHQFHFILLELESWNLSWASPKIHGVATTGSITKAKMTQNHENKKAKFVKCVAKAERRSASGEKGLV